MRKFLTTAVVLAELVAVTGTAGIAMAANAPTSTSSVDSVWARNGAAAVAIQVEHELTSQDSGQ